MMGQATLTTPPKKYQTMLVLPWGAAVVSRYTHEATSTCYLVAQVPRPSHTMKRWAWMVTMPHSHYQWSMIYHYISQARQTMNFNLQVQIGKQYIGFNWIHKIDVERWRFQTKKRQNVKCSCGLKTRARRHGIYTVLVGLIIQMDPSHSSSSSGTSAASTEI